MSQTDAVRSTVAEANRLLRSEQAAAARELLREGRPSTEDSPPPGAVPREWWRDLAALCGDAGLPERAERAWRRAAAEGLKPDVAELGALTAWRIAGDADPDRERRLEALAANLPRNSAVAHQRALLLFETGRECRALDVWRAALADSAQTECPLPSTPEALAQAALALERFLAREDAATARAELLAEAEAKAPAASPDLQGGVAARMAAIERALEARQLRTAEAWLDAETKRAVLAPRNVALLRVNACSLDDRWEEAAHALLAVPKDLEEDPLLQSLLGYALVRAGDPETGLAVLERVAPAGPDDYFSHFFRGCALTALDRRLEAFWAFRRAFEDYFFDTYHLLLVPRWREAVQILERGDEAQGETSCNAKTSNA